jgi:hypothetical protein
MSPTTCEQNSSLAMNNTVAQQPPQSQPLPTGSEPWGVIQTSASLATTKKLAQALSKKGKLPGFTPAGDSFTFVGFGEPLDYTILATKSADGITFTGKMHPKLPWIYAITTIVTLWPGSWLTDSMLRTYFQSYDFGPWFTYYWYIPLTILPLLWMFPKMIRKSKSSAVAHAREQIEVLRTQLAANPS